jgi:hypothetical protein
MTGWQQWLPPVLTALITAGFILAGNIAVKRMGRSVDDATARKTHVDADATALKTHVEAEKVRAETERMRVETDIQEVNIARALLDDVRKELDRQRGDMDRQRLDMERLRKDDDERYELLRRDSDERYEEVSNALAEIKARQRAMLIRQRAHMPWDRRVYREMQKMDPDFPEPPPLGDDD